MKKIWYYLKLFWIKWKREVEVYPVSYDQINKLLSNKFKDATIEIEDGVYYTCDSKTMKEIIGLIPTRLIKYKKEFDCDNFSKLFWASITLLFPRLPVGRCNVYTGKGKHSLNFAIYKNQVNSRLSFCFIEPQTGEMKYFNYEPYLMIV